MIRNFATVVVFGIVAGIPRAAVADSVVLEWNAVFLQAVRATRMAPPMVARAAAIVHTCEYDAWAAYSTTANGTMLGGTLRRPANEHSSENKTAAISVAAYRALVDLFPTQRALFGSLMIGLGLDPENLSEDLTTPIGIGNVACGAVLEWRHHDGANQLGDYNNGAPYSDYTGYVPINTAGALNDPSRWQPLGTQTFLVPHWGLVTPFAIASFDAIRPGPPALYPSLAYDQQAKEVVRLGAKLDDRDKAIAVYWADGPGSETPPGHWNLLTQWVSVRDGLSVDEDVRLFFLLGNALLDSSVAAWDCKRAYDSVRPVTAIRFLYAGTQIDAWQGPVDGSAWVSYIPTPPFGEYVSGHSTFSAASATILRLFTGSPRFGAGATVPAGSSPIEPESAPATEITLRWATFDQASAQAGLSRVLGGIHFRDGNLEGRHLGRVLAESVWARGQALFSGTAGPQKSSP